LFDGSRIGAIAEMSGSDQPQVSRVIDQMQRDGLVERRPSDEDNRVVQVWLTAKGRALYNKLLPHARDYVARLFRNFKRGEMDDLLTLLERLLRDIAPIGAEPAADRTPRG
jgi:DNA-binding MarR family transcriptional regulator